MPAARSTPCEACATKPITTWTHRSPPPPPMPSPPQTPPARPPTPRFPVRVSDAGQRLCDARCPGPVELGRQRGPAEPPFQARQSGGRTRIVVARLAEAGVPRTAALVEPLTDTTVRLTNL